MAKRFKLKFSCVIPSLQFCRSKDPSTFPETPMRSIHRLSPVNPKAVEISYPNLPGPPPSTPEQYPFVKRHVSSRLPSRCSVDSPENACDQGFSSDGFHGSTKSRMLEEKPKGESKGKKKKVSNKVKKRVESTAEEGKVMKESMAVVKRSEDPYEDFKGSMIEMIIEKQMFEASELEELLRCFLSLNTPQYHGVIVEAFTDIWDVLYCDSPVQHNGVINLL